MVERQHFAEIEGLRAYLALWVAIGHGLQLSGYFWGNWILSLLLRGDAAVNLFIIVSGFVITHLLYQKHEAYPQYIVRRLFRLYPAYIACSALGFACLGVWAYVVQNVPWHDTPQGAQYIASINSLLGQSTSNFWPHFIAHLTMLHGSVPEEILTHSSMTFLPAAWSISLEWQFYLVAPLIIRSLRSEAQTLLAIAAATLLFTLYSNGALGTYQMPSTIAASSPYFAIGILSRYAYDHLTGFPLSPAILSLLAVFGCCAFVRDPLPTAVWCVFYSFLVWKDRDLWATRSFRAIFENQAALKLGRISYSLYLIHRPTQVLFAGVVVYFAPSVTQPSMVVVQMAAVVAAIPASALLYRFVEKSGIRFGRELATRLSGGHPPAAWTRSSPLSLP